MKKLIIKTIRNYLTEEKKWTFDVLKDIASLYKTRQEFRIENPNAYNAALRAKIMDEITKHMGETLNKHKSTQEFINKANLIHNNKFNYDKSEYVTTNTPLIVTCPQHGDFLVTPKEHYKKISGGCTKCSNKYRRGVDDFKEEANKIHDGKYTYDKTIFNIVSDRVIITCPIHGDFTQIARDHLRGHGCPDCSGLKRKTTENFIKQAKEIHGNKYEYDDVDYINNRTDVLIKCKIHGNFKQRPSNHLRGAGCPKCKESNGEKIVQQILEKNKIDFIKQKKFKDCIGVGKKFCRQLPFDFYLPKYNVCIEYDGRQHSVPIYGYEQLVMQKTIDSIKNEYCKKNNILLIRIPYLVDDIEDLLKKELKIK